MLRKFTACVLLIAAAALALCGCTALFDKEYVAVNDYVPPASEDTENEKIDVSDFDELRQAVMEMVSEGREDGIIRFAPEYSRDSTEDMKNACWQLRSQDALCAYCVENISYELSSVSDHKEADVRISYVSGRDAENIVKLRYSAGVEEYIRSAFENGETKLAVLINRSAHTADSMETLAVSVYRDYPGSAPVQPRVNVNIFSGEGSQRLYEININYGMGKDELQHMQQQLAELEPFDDGSMAKLSEPERAYAACRYLMENCRYEADRKYNDIYAALIGGRADSEGLAFAYVDLCSRLSLDCSIVYVQRNWEDCCWNIVKVDGEYYHVDIAGCMESGPELNFLMSDEDIWERYRWVRSSYAQC